MYDFDDDVPKNPIYMRALYVKEDLLRTLDRPAEWKASWAFLQEVFTLGDRTGWTDEGMFALSNTLDPVPKGRDPKWRKSVRNLVNMLKKVEPLAIHTEF